MPSRRGFLAGLTSTALAPSLGWAAAGNPVALSAAMTPDDRHWLIGLRADGGEAFRIPLSARGHAAAAHPTLAEAVAIARRPGTFAKVIDCVTGVVRQELQAPKGRHFYGHGAFDPSGTLLFTTENDIASGQGRIGVWDRSLGYLRIDEFASAGIGPHEILRLPNGDLAVANGGIRTHPDSGREKLNLDMMAPNLTVFDLSGSIRDQAIVPDAIHHNSVRHIASAPDGTVICGMQWQGDPFAAPDLVNFYRGDGELRTTAMDDTLLYRLDGYIGSVAAAADGSFFASAPRGNLAMVFDADGQIVQTFTSHDVCGICGRENGAMITTGDGLIAHFGQSQFAPLQHHGLFFDNHLVAI